MNKLKNTVQLIGRTGIEPIVRTFENGTKLAKFSLATNETIRDVNGKKTLTQWHQIVAWGRTAELIEKYLHKGQMVAVDGKLVNRAYKDNGGGNHRRTEVQVHDIMMINKQKAG
ncbi:single-stranded DNA-binding protein [Crocinitomix algicola]|uniref:single-stranded DNA-binding protein n=1 Tax=Crocinitomix algicola TaxID=1740263 RepID=UPI000831EA53|nr:single-stranded DNA-binding protein [Crocinitomix algicola]